MKFRPDQVTPVRCSLLGYALESLQVDGTYLPRSFLQVNLQPEVGNNGYDAGARILEDFFHRELQQFLVPDLHPLVRKIIECCLNRGSVEDFHELIPQGGIK